MNRYDFLIEQYRKLDIVYGLLILVAVYFPAMGHMLDSLLHDPRTRRWLDWFIALAVVVHLAVLFYCGYINLGG